jgi:hypothetical protein
LGLADNVVLTAVLKWFPERPGLSSGVLMMGHGISCLGRSAAV